MANGAANILNQVVAFNSPASEKSDVFQSALKIKQAVDAFKKVEYLENQSIIADGELNKAVVNLSYDEFRLYMKITAEGV